MTARTIAIGDIHGCAAALDALIEEIQPAKEDTLIFLGDLIDRGPDARSTVSRIIELQGVTHVVNLLGNHEVMLLMAIADPEHLDFWLDNGGQETLDSYEGRYEGRYEGEGGVKGIPEAHLQLFRQGKLYHETEHHFFVHANFTPRVPLAQQQEYVLLWEHLSAHMPGPHISGKLGIVGHTPQLDGEVLITDSLICIDTWCYGDGYLTALDVEDGSLWQATKDGVLRDEEMA